MYPGHAILGPATRLKIDGVSTLAMAPTASTTSGSPISFPLLASVVLLKPVQWTRSGGSPGRISGIRWRLVWAEARTQESFLGEEDFVDRFEEALNTLPRRNAS